jgi:hypothetical protein
VPSIEDIKANHGQPHLAWGRLESLADHCFLCDIPLTSENRTGEDVLPRWLQRMFRLQANATLRLLNGTGLRYAAIRIPCCSTCNNEWLSRAENEVRRAFSAGHEAVADLDPDLLYAWLAKIFYGVLYREALLPAARASGDAAPIVPAEALQTMAMYRMLLQWFRGRTAWATLPGSVFLYRAQTLDELGHNFDFADNVPLQCIAMRIGSTAVVAALSDWGLLREAAPRRLGFPSEIALHPIQFRELYATVIDYESRRQFDSCYTSLAIGDDVDAMVLNRCLHRMTDPPYAEHDSGPWGALLSFVTGIPHEALVSGDRVSTYLMDKAGAPRFMPFGGGTGVAIVDGAEYEFPENPAIGMFRKSEDQS